MQHDGPGAHIGRDACGGEEHVLRDLYTRCSVRAGVVQGSTQAHAPCVLCAWRGVVLSSRFECAERHVGGTDLDARFEGRGEGTWMPEAWTVMPLWKVEGEWTKLTTASWAVAWRVRVPEHEGWVSE